MTDDAPMVGLSANEIWQLTQAANAVSAAISKFGARMRARQAREGRLANSDSENTARQHAARRHPPLRLMTDDELLEWQRRVPSSLAAQQLNNEPFSVVPAQMVDGNGKPTGEWGIEATTWEPGSATPTSKLMLVCRDADDALAMAHHLRSTGTPEHFGYLHDLAARAPGQFVHAPAPAPSSPTGPQWGGHAAPLVLSEDHWEAALRDVLPAELADRVVVRNPAHEHNSAWRELHELANEEVFRVGADPNRLAQLVRDVPGWRGDVQTPPAMGHWAITHSRGQEDYLNLVVPGRIGDPATASDQGAAAPAPAAEPKPRSVLDVRSPDQARVWAEGLDATNPQHRIEAEFGYGRWGDDVNGILSRKFPDLTEKLRNVAKREQERRDAEASRMPVDTAAETTLDPATERALLDEVDRLDISKPGDRRAAHTMLGTPSDREGRVPSAVDRRIAERFADDPLIKELLEIQYPNGFPEAEATALRNRGQGDDVEAAADQARPDDPQTPQREDVAGEAEAHGEQGAAAQRRGAAGTVLAGEQSPVVRRTTSKVPQPHLDPAHRR